jgi:hypothetical protein
MYLNTHCRLHRDALDCKFPSLQSKIDEDKLLKIFWHKTSVFSDLPADETSSPNAPDLDLNDLLYHSMDLYHVAS